MFLCVGCLSAVKVIVLSQNINSHIIYHARIARLLADEGHVVEMIVPSNVKIPVVMKEGNVGILWYTVPTNETFPNTKEASRMISESVMANWAFERLAKKIRFLKMGMDHWAVECSALLNDESIRMHLFNTKYDIAIVDPAALKCHVSLLYQMKIPIILLGIVPMDWTLRIPSLPSFVPSLFSTFGESMSFLERLQNTLIHFASEMLFIVLAAQSLPGTNPPARVSDVINTVQLNFVLDDISISYPKPAMSNFIYIGDAIPEAVKTLPKEIEAFVQSAQDGVIIVSFGSYFDYLPSEVNTKLCSAFKQIPQRVVWKLKNKTACDADANKVMLLDWLPQNDLLSHGNVKLFISHCGINSILESVYHSTPILAFPASLDQPHNARRLANLGLGYEMNLRDFSTDDLTSKISAILSDETILKNIRRASELMRKRPDKPGRRLSYWVQHVVDYGSNHLKTKAYELNIFQFWCFDVLLALVIILGLTTSLLGLCLKLAYKRVMNCLRNKSKTE